MTDVFALSAAEHDFFCAAARRAAIELDLFPLLAASDSEIAGSLGLPPRRLAILLRALRQHGVLDDKGPSDVPPSDFAELAEVIRIDRPLDAQHHTSRWQAQLCTIGQAAAAELAPWLLALSTRRTLLDLGGGLGTYARAFAAGGGAATVIDRKEIIDQAAPGEGVCFVSGDIFRCQQNGFGVALLSNVLHWYSEAECAALCAHARTLGEHVVVKDLDVRSGRGVWFALTMALYSQAGDLYDAEQIVQWLGGQASVRSEADQVVVWT